MLRPRPRNLLLLAAPLVASALGCGGQPSDSAASGPPPGLPVRTARIEARDLDETLVLTGTLKPRAQVELVAEVAARLVRVRRDEGALVARGETLAELDETDYRLSHDRARAALGVAQANRAHTLAEKERAESLLRTGGITDKDRLAAEVALQVAEASLAQARAEAEIAATQLARTKLTAPFSGRIGYRHRDEGAMLAAGTPLFTLVDDSLLEFEARVASRELARLRLGAPASVSVDALPGVAIAGKVARLAPLVDERTRSFKVVVEVRHQEGLVGGLFARASVAVGRAPGALVVPPAALVRDGSDPSRGAVFVVREGKAERQELELGVEAPNGVQARSGLAAGDVVVLDPPGTLASGTPVQAQDERPAGPGPAPAPGARPQAESRGASEAAGPGSGAHSRAEGARCS